MGLQGIEVEGVIIKEYPAKEGVSKSTNNPWKSQEFVIQTKDQYPRACLFRVFGADRIQQFNLHEGDTVHVYLDINARAWQDRYFNDINAFRVDHIDPNTLNSTATAQPGVIPSAASAQSGGASEATAAAPGQSPAANSDPLGGGDSSDDLPF